MVYSKQFFLSFLIAAIIPLTGFIGFNIFLNSILLKEKAQLINLRGKLSRKLTREVDEKGRQILSQEYICNKLLYDIEEGQQIDISTLKHYSKDIIISQANFNNKEKEERNTFNQKIKSLFQEIENLNVNENFNYQILLAIGLIILTFILTLYKRMNPYIWSGLFVGFSIFLFDAYFLRIMPILNPFAYINNLIYLVIISILMQMIFIFKPGTILSLLLPFFFLNYYVSQPDAFHSLGKKENQRLKQFEKINSTYHTDPKYYIYSDKKTELRENACKNLTDILTTTISSDTRLETKFTQFSKKYLAELDAINKLMQPTFTNLKKGKEELIKFDSQTNEGKRNTLFLSLIFLIYLIYLSYFLYGTTIFYGITAALTSITLAIWQLETGSSDFYSFFSYHSDCTLICLLSLTCLLSLFIFNLLKREKALLD